MLVLRRLFCNWEESDMVEWKKLEEIAKYRRGSFPQPYGKEEWYNGEGAMPFVQVADVEENAMCLKETTKQYISTLAMPMSVYVPQGSIVVTLQGSIGKVAITQYESYVDRTLGIFTGFKIPINKKYFVYQLQKIFSIKKEKARGGIIKTITKEEFSKFEIPIPSKSEQERIVSILDTFTSSISNLKEQIKERRKQYEYYRDQLLDLEGKDGVEMKTLGEVAKYRRGSFPQPYGNEEWYNGEGAMPFVQVADVEENGMKLKDSTKQFISTLAMPMSVFVPQGSIVVTLQGSIGKVAITQYDSYVDRTLGIFTGFLINIDKKYFAHQLLKIFSIKKKKARGGIIKTITKEEFSQFAIPIPSKEEQLRIVTILDQFEASIANLEAQLKEREKQYEYYRNQLLTFE